VTTTRRFLFAAAALLLAAVGAGAGEPAVTFDAAPGRLHVRVNGRPLATYVYQDAAIKRPYFAHVHAPNGVPVTRTHPPVAGTDATDHADMHPGLWLAFGDLSGADYWRNKGRVVQEDVTTHDGSFAVRNRYETADGKVLAREAARYTFQARPAGTLLVWDSEFRPADGELAFGDQEEMGLGVRLATPLTVKAGGQIAGSGGERNETQVRGKQHNWCDYSGTVSGERVGVLIVPDPRNFGRSGFHARDYGLLVANPFARKALGKGEPGRVVVKSGEALRLRFGVMLHSTPAGAAFDAAAAAADVLAQLASGRAAPGTEQWDVYEITLPGPATGNPFVDVSLSARFTQGDSVVTATGFYDGDGTYKVRFMPDRAGEWRYETASNVPALAGKSGTFTAAPPASGNHGPVRVRNTFHFAYADGTPHIPVGTTCYVWNHQGDELERQTLATLKQGPFNKLRFCVFPKHYAYNQNEPPLYPFEGTPQTRWDFTRFNPAFFRHLEQRIADLRDLGIEADLILLHPYDKGHWGFDRMPAADDDRYLRYVVARLAAYRNVWWSLANEFDFMKEKRESDWDRFFRIVADTDPYGHLRSIHNGTLLYNHSHPWVTHASIQNGSAVEDAGRAALYRDVYRKPIVFDEVKYEGDIPQRWGNLSAEEMVHRFWQGTVAGTYVGHGETYRHPSDVLWWSKGGVLRGQSPPRIAFLRKVLEVGPAAGIEPIDKWQDERTAGQAGQYYLVYLGKDRPADWVFELPRKELQAGMRFTAEVLDAWDMTVTPVPGEFVIRADAGYRYRAEGERAIKLPGRPYQVIRIRRM
jgi:hypothetical protein